MPIYFNREKENDNAEGKNMDKDIILSISILVSNNIKTIDKCLESICPILEQTPSELIVVDTVGSEYSDGSLDIAKKHATKVVRFEWCNDFAAARNAGLKEAKGKWFMFMDDDEWFEDVEEIIQFFKSGAYQNYASATYQIRNYTNKQGTSYNVATLGRMVQRTEGLQFVGRIHEVFSEMKLPCKELSSFVHHYGYVYDSEEEKRAHSKRNVELLKEELGKDPNNLRYRTQMALELATFDNSAALDFCEETFRICDAQGKKNNFQWQLALVFRLYEALGVNSEVADAKYVDLKEKFGYNETTEQAISYQMTRIHIINNVPERAHPYAVRFFECLQFLQNHPEQRQLQMTADFQRYQEVSTNLEMLHFGAYSAYCAGEYEAAWNWYMQMPWEQKEFRNEEAFQLMVQLFQKKPNVSVMISILRRVMKNESLIGKQEIRNTISAILALFK